MWADVIQTHSATAQGFGKAATVHAPIARGRFLQAGRVRPTWLRYSDFNQDPQYIVELGENQLL